MFDEVRVHACLALIRHIIETFLVDEALPLGGGILWQQLLSPDLVTHEGRLSLLDIEMNLKHRRISRQRNSVSAEGGNASGSSGSTYSSGRNSGSSAASATGMRTPNPKLISPVSSNALVSAPPSISRVPNNKSLPRNWGKNYAGGGQRRTSASLGSEGKSGSSANPTAQAATASSPTSQAADEEYAADYETNIRYLHRIIAVTMLRTLRTAVDQFEWVIRLIEVPFDCSGSSRRGNSQMQQPESVVTMDQAYALLGSLTDLLFLLINRANAIETLFSNIDGDIEEDVEEDEDDPEDKDQCFLTDLFQYLQVFVVRFQKALFACRIADLPLIHDQCRIQLLLSIAASGKMLVVRQHAARLLCKLTALCYEQTGSFSLVKRPIFKVFCSVFFSSISGQLLIPTESLREAIEEMRQCSLAEENATQAFLIQYKELLNGLITQIKVFEMWQVAIGSPEQLRDYEEIEEGLYRIMRAISPFWLLDEKKQWLDALLSLHVTRKKYAEAACCKLECIEFTKQIVQEEEQGEFLFWQVRELVLARELAEKAEWLEQQISTSEQLLMCLKEQRRYPEYIETLRYLERAVCQHAEAEAGGGCGNSHAFYRVTYAGDCVSTHISKHEYIYKRNKFMSLGEFVSEMKAMLRVKYPMSERVDVVPEVKPLIGDDQPNVIFMRVTSVEEVKKSDSKQPPHGDNSCNPIGLSVMVFRFAMPFTLGSSAYGKTSEQMKRITFLTVAQQFPCALNRQVVVERREEIRCPIDNSMDDIQKRCLLLQDEIMKEIRGRTDLKTLTLVLKGSVDTHVHGGIPEVVESFLASKADPTASAQEQVHDDESQKQGGFSTNFPPLLDPRGAVLNEDESLQKRHQLANLLVHFLTLCWQCLLISREAFRRASSQSSISVSSTPSSSSPYLQLSSESVSLLSSSTSLGGVSTSFAPSGSGTAAHTTNASPTKAPGAMSTNGFLSLFLPDDDTTTTTQLSPLQLEFERSFASLVELVQRKVAFPYQSAGDVTYLQQQMQFRRMGSVAPTSPASAAASNGS